MRHMPPLLLLFLALATATTAVGETGDPARHEATNGTTDEAIPAPSGDVARRLAHAVEDCRRSSPGLAALRAAQQADAASAAGAAAPGNPFVEGEIRDKRWPGGGAVDGLASVGIGVPFHYPWQWAEDGVLLHQARRWAEVADLAAERAFTRDLVVAWIRWAAATERTDLTTRWLATADTVLAQEGKRLAAGSLPPVEAAWLQVERARTASRHHEARMEGAELGTEVQRLAGGRVPPARPGDVPALLALTATPTGDRAALVQALHAGALFRAAAAEADLLRAEGEARAAAAGGAPRVEAALRQGTEVPFAWDLEGAVGLRVPLPVGRQVREDRAEGHAMSVAGERTRDAVEIEFIQRLDALLQAAEAARAWMDSQSGAVTVLDGAEATLARQYALDVLSGSDYLDDLERVLRVRLQVVDAAEALLLARLDLAILLEDPRVFPPAFPGEPPPEQAGEQPVYP